MTSTVDYLGDLRTTCVHLKSGKTIITDAPTDNNGKGEAFSPTDLVATALASCMITIMGIKANQKGLNIDGTKAEVTKYMASNPRRIEKVDVKIIFPENNWDEAIKKLLEQSAKNCPVAKSLASELVQEVSFEYELS